MVPVTHFLPATGALTALKYITWNPVEAGYVEHPEDWVWSSHRTTAGLAEPLSVSESDDYLNHIVVVRRLPGCDPQADWSDDARLDHSAELSIAGAPR